MSNSTETGFEVKPLPPFLRHTLSKVKLMPEHIMKASARMANLPPNFPAHVEQALEVLCRSYTDEARLHWFGKKNVWYLLSSGLSTLLQIEEQFKQNPDLQNTKINPFLVVTGLPRSGTTYLHRMLSAPPDAFGIPLYQHIWPLKMSRVYFRKWHVQANFKPWQWAGKRYGMDSMHRIRPTLPDECTFGMRLAAHSMLYWATAPTYQYLQWLLEQDLSETYALYRKVLILHQRQRPNQYLVLKCPHHMAYLPSLVSALPEALIVQTHRDPTQIVASETKLILSLHAMATQNLDWRKSVDHNLLKVSTYASRSVDFSRSKQGKQVFHADYRKLLQDPKKLVQKIHHHFGLQPVQNEVIANYIHHNKQHKHGKNHYSLSQFDMDEKAISQTFQSYVHRFLS